MWFLDDELSSYATHVLRDLTEGGSAVVPSLWTFELANALVVAERRGRIGEADTARILGLARALPIETDATALAEILDRVIPLARAHAITAYDAAYLELAMRLSAPLATLDRNLQAAAGRAGVAAA